MNDTLRKAAERSEGVLDTVAMGIVEQHEVEQTLNALRAALATYAERERAGEAQDDLVEQVLAAEDWLHEQWKDCDTDCHCPLHTLIPALARFRELDLAIPVYGARARCADCKTSITFGPHGWSHDIPAMGDWSITAHHTARPMEDRT